MHKVCLALPGASMCWGTAKAVIGLANSQLEVSLRNSGNGWDDFNGLWAQALNEFEAGAITHFAMLHSDIAPLGDWIDVLLAELDRGFDLVSAIAPIKDSRGVTSSGIGDESDNWHPFRRFTMAEVCRMPETFTASTIGYGHRFLLHNSGCWACDLRSGLFNRTNEVGELIAHFDFPRRVVRRDGKFVNDSESEDWFFSRKIHKLGARSAITRKVKLTHKGPIAMPNDEPWGSYTAGDVDTQHKWESDRGDI